MEVASLAEPNQHPIAELEGFTRQSETAAENGTLEKEDVSTSASQSTGREEDDNNNRNNNGTQEIPPPQNKEPDVSGNKSADGAAAYKWRQRLARYRHVLLGTRKKCIIFFTIMIMVILLIILLSTLLTLLPRHAAAAPASATAGSGPGQSTLVADVGYGKYQGVKLPSGVTQWLGMRYMGPPTGENRFAAPVPPTPFNGIQMADRTLPGCQGVGPKATGVENCPSVDVYAPSSATTTSGLPVYVFLQGGGNEGAFGHFNGSKLITTSGMNMVFVSFTYRVGAYGFLASKEVQAGASLNNGYKDQRALLQWVKDHISSFGGNSNAITLGGQSAGAGAAVAHMMAYGETDNGGLFHSALIESPSTPFTPTVAQQQFQYDDLVTKLNCSDQEDTLACLRAIPHDQFIAQVGSIPFPGQQDKPVFAWNPVIDDDLLPYPSLEGFANGKFVQVPTIIGDVTNEGTIFTPKTISTAADTNAFLSGTFPNLLSAELAQIGQLYNFSNLEPAPYWEHAASSYGELRYTCPAGNVATLMTQHGNQNVWRYQYDVLLPANAKNGLGVPHGSELSAVFGSGPGGTNAAIIPLVQKYWASFVRVGDPNTYRNSGAPTWSNWNSHKMRMHLIAQNPGMLAVGQQEQERCAYLDGIALGLAQ